MYHRIRESKYREEIVTFVWDFSDHINPGDTILGTPLIAVLVSSGVDSNPSDLISGMPVVTNGTVVSQKIRRGIPGTIYTITITIDTVQGDTFEDLTYLAILPLLGVSFTFYLETMLYPIEMYYESLVTSITLISGKLFQSVDMVPEGITGAITLISGTLIGNPIYYTMTVLDPTNGNEAINSFITLISGTLFGGPLNYDMTTEGLQANITLIDGILFGNPLNYDMLTEGINSYITLIGGTLV